MSETFHKNIDLFTANGNNTGNAGNINDVKPQAKKNLSCYSNTDLNRFSRNNVSVSGSFFSRSTYHSSAFMSVRSTSGGPAPRVSIQGIIKKKAQMYYDEALAQTFDELLDNGYSLVAAKKAEREQLRTQEENFLTEIAAVEKEVIPLISRMMTLKAQVSGQNEQNEKYSAEISSQKEEIREITAQISNRVEEIKESETVLINRTKKIEQEINEIRSEIASNKASHKRDKENLTSAVKKRKEVLEGLTSNLDKLKSTYEQRRFELNEKLRKMENKSKMFIGILKH
eukprot:TRINITY_DN0_c155_g1_i6.p1 TRINITY_DN0_c155_g1~~TRINITY_DN0_c155_g1_i6.p1  ORF type:complete len:285 (+),score=82.99 TRINITY_DN0_c155_g1_i6:49-903(+)